MSAVQRGSDPIVRHIDVLRPWVMVIPAAVGAAAHHTWPALVPQTLCTRHLLLLSLSWSSKGLLGAEVGLGVSLCFHGLADASVTLVSGWERYSCTGTVCAGCAITRSGEVGTRRPGSLPLHSRDLRVQSLTQEESRQVM